MEATLSSKNQVVIPKEAREALGLKSGDKLLLVLHGDKMLLLQKPKSYSKALRGIAKGLYPDNYLQTERDSWE